MSLKEKEARVRKISAAIERRRASGLNTKLTENLLYTMLVSLSLLIDTKVKIEAELSISSRDYGTAKRRSLHLATTYPIAVRTSP
jgi:hypothetical protein